MMPRPEVIASSTTIAFSGSSTPNVVARPGKVISPLGRGGRSAFSAGIGLRFCNDNAVTSASSAPTIIFPWTCQRMDFTFRGGQHTALAGISEVGNWSSRSYQNQLANIFQQFDCLLRHVRNSLNERSTGTSLDARNRIGREQFRIGGSGDAAGCFKAFAIECISAEQECRGQIRAEHCCRAIDSFRGGHWRCRYRGNAGDGATVAPGNIGRNDQRGNLARRGAGGNDGLGGVATNRGRQRRMCATIWNRAAQSPRYRT